METSAKKSAVAGTSPAAAVEGIALKPLSLAAYGAPALATYFLLNPTWSILPGVYAKYYGLELTTIAGVVLLSRIFAAVADPLVGFLSDKHRSAGGSRKTWVVIGGLGLIVSAYSIYLPPAGSSWVHFLACLSAFLFCWTMVEIPQLAWGREIAQERADRAIVFGWRVGFVFSGHALFFLIPFLPWMATREYTPALLREALLIGVSIMVVTLAFNLRWAPDGRPLRNVESDSLSRFFQSLLLNRPLLHFAVFYLFVGVGFGMWYGLMFLFLSSFLGYGQQVALIFLAASLLGFASIPAWLGLIRRFGVKRVFMAGLCLFAFALATSLFLTPASSWWLAGGLVCLGFISLAVHNVAIPSLVSDIADYGMWKFRVDRSATYFALSALLDKATYAIGGSFAFWMISLFSLDPAANVQSKRAIFGLHIAYSGIPILLILVGMLLLSAGPLTARRCEGIRRRLA